MSSARPRPDRQRGVFETLLVLDGEPVELDAHLARLDSSLRTLFSAPAPARLAEDLAAAAGDIARGGLRVTVAPSAGEEIGVAIERVEIEPDRILPPKPAAIDVRTLTVRGGLGGHKWADRRLLERSRAGLSDDDTVLIVDWDDTLLEAARANAFAVFGGAVLTAPADGRILPGVARSRTIEAATAAGLEVRETNLPCEGLAAADELFLTGSLRGVELIRRLDGSELETTCEVACMIHAALRRAWAGAGLDRVPRR